MIVKMAFVCCIAADRSRIDPEIWDMSARILLHD